MKGQKEKRGIIEKAPSLREYIYGLEQNTAGNMNIKGSSGEALQGKMNIL